MDSATVMERMYYIIDGRGNYYRTNEEDQLIVSQDRDNADLFELKEANKRINNGRKMYFYSILPAEPARALPTVAEQKDADMDETEALAKDEQEESGYLYDLEQLDWKEYLLFFTFVVSGLKKYQDKLNHELSEVDMCICDLMHYLELYDLSDEEYIKAAAMIKEYREKRRMIKDKAHMAECFQKTIGTNNNLLKAREAMNLINKLDRRTYKPRVLTEIFEHGTVLTKREETRVEAGAKIREEAAESMEILERRETVFDNGEKDWGSFVTEQARFFADARQYACNLQITLNELDEEIEQLLNDIEDANCNVTQGYKVFKMLKDLRSERKKVAKELESVRTITGCFDCEAMRDAYRYCEQRIGEIQGE